MSVPKKIAFYIGNVIIAVMAFYAYMLTYVAFSWGEQFTLFSEETLVSVPTGALFFGTFNFLLLRNETHAKRYWITALSIVVVTLLTIVLILEYPW